MMKKFLLFLLMLALLAAGYIWLALKWSYSSGERAGYVQKFSNKGWVCKTWEGEIALVSMPGAVAEKFYFTVHDEAVAQKIARAMGKRVALHYEEKVGLPTSCFGETSYFVKSVTLTDEPAAPTPSAPSAAPAAAPVAPVATVAPAAPAAALPAALPAAVAPASPAAPAVAPAAGAVPAAPAAAASR